MPVAVRPLASIGWFTGLATIGRVSVTGAVTSFPVPATSTDLMARHPAFITAGADGAVWFTEEGGPGDYDHFNRMTTDGKITTFTHGVPPGTALIDLTTDRDGNLWFTYQQTGTPGGLSPGVGRLNIFPRR